MHSLLNQLESDETLLLMYAAGELSAQDRAQVEERLASDPALREQLERVRELSGSVDDAIGRLDAGARLPVSEGVAVRKVARVMRQWQIDRMAPPPPEEPENQLRFPWWSYPLSMAAALLLAFVVWWGQQDGPPAPRTGRIASIEQPSDAGGPTMWDANDVMARRLRFSWWSGYEMTSGLQFEGDPDAWASAEEPQLDDVEGIFLAPVSFDERIQ